MGISTLVLSTTSVGSRQPLAENEPGRKEAKMMRFTLTGRSSLDSTETSRGAFENMASVSLRLVMDFLSPRDRFALMSTQKNMLKEQFATTFTSQCNQCADCIAKNQHLCKRGDNQRPDSFWTTILRYSGTTGLRELHLSSCDAFSTKFLREMDSQVVQKALSTLQVLELNQCRALDAEGLMILAETCVHLRELRLQDMSVDNAACTRFVINNQSTLRVVCFVGCHTLSGTEVRALTLCQDLNDLSLVGCFNVDNASISEVASECKALQRLNLRYCHKVDDALVCSIASSASKLRDLNLRYCTKITDASISVLCDRLKNLETLNLSQCTKITDMAIRSIVAKLTSLKELRLWGCAKLTAASIIAISEGLPLLTLVDIRSRDNVIGGSTTLKVLFETYRNTLARWEQGDQVGVFKRLPMCAVAA